MRDPVADGLHGVDRSRSSSRRAPARASVPRGTRGCRTPAEAAVGVETPFEPLVSSGSNGLIADTPARRLAGLPPETKAATSRISCSLSWPPNAGIPPPPLFTWRATSSAEGFASSRFGPTVPLDPAASSAWQPPHPASAKTFAPGSLDPEPDSPPPPAPREDARGRRVVVSMSSTGAACAKGTWGVMTLAGRLPPGRATTVSSPRRAQGVRRAPTGGEVSGAASRSDRRLRRGPWRRGPAACSTPVAASAPSRSSS